jgi:hypothetical protein
VNIELRERLRHEKGSSAISSFRATTGGWSSDS